MNVFENAAEFNSIAHPQKNKEAFDACFIALDKELEYAKICLGNMDTADNVRSASVAQMGVIEALLDIIYASAALLDVIGCNAEELMEHVHIANIYRVNGQDTLVPRAEARLLFPIGEPLKLRQAKMKESIAKALADNVLRRI